MTARQLTFDEWCQPPTKNGWIVLGKTRTKLGATLWLTQCWKCKSETSIRYRGGGRLTKGSMCDACARETRRRHPKDCHIVYCLLDRTNNIIYIGQTISWSRRSRGHRRIICDTYIRYVMPGIEPYECYQRTKKYHERQNVCQQPAATQVKQIADSVEAHLIAFYAPRENEMSNAVICSKYRRAAARVPITMSQWGEQLKPDRLVIVANGWTLEPEVMAI